MNTVLKPRLSDKAEQEILRRIHAGDLPVGTRLPSEPEFAQQLGISRGILREALNSLQTKGYLSRTPRGGSYIKRTADDHIGESITAKVRTASLTDLVEFRDALESRVVQCIIDRATDEQIDALEDLLKHPVGENNSIDYYFHYRLAELSGNNLFVVFLDMYYDTLHHYALGSYRDEKRQTMMNTEHVKIVRALKKRDKRAAVAAVKVHMRNVQRRVLGDYDVYV